MLIKQEKRIKRHKRARAKIFGTAKVPRLCVFRSDSHIYSQLIDDEKGKTLVSASDLEIKKLPKEKLESKTNLNIKEEKNEIPKTRKVEIAFRVGKLLAEKAIGKKIEKIIFDKGGYKYHGRVKAVADGARNGGLIF